MGRLAENRLVAMSGMEKGNLWKSGRGQRQEYVAECGTILSQEVPAFAFLNVPPHMGLGQELWRLLGPRSYRLKAVVISKQCLPHSRNICAIVFLDIL